MCLYLSFLTSVALAHSFFRSMNLTITTIFFIYIISFSNAFQSKSVIVPDRLYGRKYSSLLMSSLSKQPIHHHHTAIRTRNIENSIKFYSLFGYDIETKFRSGPARCAWLTNTSPVTDDKTTLPRKGQTGVSSRLELIEIPSYILQEREGTMKRAVDLIQKEDMLGINHVCLDVTSYVQKIATDEYYGLDQFLNDVNQDSLEKFNKTLRVAVSPRQQVIGSQVYELAFIYDADGCVIELLRYIKDLKQNISSGWEPWDGVGFIGKNDE